MQSLGLAAAQEGRVKVKGLQVCSSALIPHLFMILYGLVTLRLRLLENPYGIKGATRLVEAWEACSLLLSERATEPLSHRRQESQRGLGQRQTFVHTVRHVDIVVRCCRQ